MQQAIYITQSRMPDPQRFFRLCAECFESLWVTNNGALVRQLERELKRYLGIPSLLVCNNGATALMLALRCAGLAGKKIAVTPYIYVATLSALLWIGCTPAFVDVEPDTLCLSPDLLRQRLREDPDIAGVLSVHVYGLAGDVEGLEAVCHEHGIPLVYDAALGLSLLEGTAEEIRRRGELRAMYDEALAGLPLERPAPRAGLEWNNAYYPVLLPAGASRERVEKALAERNIHPRRYFYPALNRLPYLREEWRRACPVAEGAAERVLCLPLYGALGEDALGVIVRIVTETLGKAA